MCYVFSCFFFCRQNASSHFISCCRTARSVERRLRQREREREREGEPCRSPTLLPPPASFSVSLLLLCSSSCYCQAIMTRENRCATIERQRDERLKRKNISTLEFLFLTRSLEAAREVARLERRHTRSCYYCLCTRAQLQLSQLMALAPVGLP